MVKQTRRKTLSREGKDALVNVIFSQIALLERANQLNWIRLSNKTASR
jgi:hypothetical protein